MFTKWKKYNNNMNALNVGYFCQIFIVFLIILGQDNYATGCQIYPIGEYIKLVKVTKNLEKGSEIFPLEVHPRDNLKIVSVDREKDSQYFSYREVNKTHISVILDESLEDFVEDNSAPTLLTFRIICNSSVGTESLTTSRLSVTIFVEDVNNHTPQFIGTPYYTTVDELTPVGTKILCGIHAIDKDKPSTPNSDVYYTITDGNEEKKFSLENGDNGTCIALSKNLDYDKGERQFIIIVAAMDRGIPSKSSNSTVTIKVRDNDDLNPKFTQEVYKAQIKEFQQFPKILSIHEEINFTNPIHAFDQDRGINTPVRYDIQAGNERGIFYLDPQNGSLFLNQALDFDSEKHLVENTFVLKIHASQIDNPLKFATAKVEIEIFDVNDNLPEFEVDFYNISIVENLPNGFSVLQVVAYDKDQGQNSEFKYELDDPSGAFLIDPNSGWLIVRDESILDREQRALIKMKVYAVEKVPNVISFSTHDTSLTIPPLQQPRSSVDVEVTLLDANDNNPIFVPSNLYELVAQSDSRVGTVLGQVHAVDKDQGRNGMVLYQLQRPGNSSYGIPFQVDSLTGVISVIESPIVEGRHAIFIEATDQPLNPSERRFSLAVVAIDVFPLDGFNAGIPDFMGAPYEFWVGIDVPIGTTVGQIRTNNAVRTVGLLYDLLHGYHEGVPFAIEENSGTITVVDEIRKYNRLFYDFEAVTTNEKDLTLITNVSIHVVDSTTNDKPENFSHETTKAPLIFHISENCASAFIGQVLPANNDTNLPNNIHFFIANQQDVPDIDIMDDGSLYTNRGLDREKKQNYSVTIVAEHLRGIGIFQVTVVIDDENDNPPTFNSHYYEGHILENSPVGTKVTIKNHIFAQDPDDGINASFVFALLGDGSNLFEIDLKTGEIFYKGNEEHILDREIKSVYNMKIVATDIGDLKTEAELSITVEDVNDNAPNFTQIVILPDHSIRVSKELSESSSSTANIDSNLSVIKEDANRNKQRRSPILYIPENVTLGTPILRLVANDKDENKDQEIKYEILFESWFNDNDNSSSGRSVLNLKTKRFFAIDSRSGDISVIRNLPAETDIQVDVRARDIGNLTDQMALKIHVTDVNDHPPLFKQSLYLFEIQEGVYDQYRIATVTAFDSDFGNNANITYELIADGYAEGNDYESVQFNIGKYTGELAVSGTLDRETKNMYNFVIKARNQARDAVSSLSSTTDVEIKILDINDNPPTFFGYDKISKLYTHTEHEVASNSDDKTSKQLIPVYEVSIRDDIPIGSKIAKIFANDSDFIGNGNGLVLFDLVNLRDEKPYFTIDSKEGLVTTIASLKYENLNVYNLTIIASDLGTPSLSSTARLLVTVTETGHHQDHHRNDNKIDDENYHQEKAPVFQHRYYEIQVEENNEVPLKLVQLTTSVAAAEEEKHKHHLSHFSIVYDKSSSNSNYFSIDSKNGTLYLIKLVDREQEDSYEIIVKVDKIEKQSRGMPIMIYPITEEKLNDLAFNEARVIVKIKDVNDNAPKFKIMADAGSRPLVAVIPTGAPFGYEIMKVEAEDADEGINGEIRYQILSNEDEPPRFAIDPVSGQVKSVANFARDAGRVFGFDVKATDKQGAEDGLSSIINVIVYVLDDLQKQVVMTMGKRPSDLEKQMENITMILKNMTGFDIRIRKLEPHIQKNLIDNDSSDVYLYAVDPNLNVVIDTETLHNAFHNKKMEIKRELDKYNILDITKNVPRRMNQRYLLSTLEVGVVALGCVVFVGTLITALCVTCIRRNKSHQRRQNTKLFTTASPPAVGFALTDASGTLQKPSFFPSVADLHSLHYDPEPFSSDIQRQNFPDHESNGIRFQRTPGGVGKQSMRFETSATSLYSSGQDSGIVARVCHCSNSYSPSSGESSNDYEDSLKSFQQHINSRDNEVSHIQTVGTRTKSSTAFSRKHAKHHALLNLESAAYPTQELTLSRENRYRTLMDQKQQQQRHMNSLGREHRRSFSDTENNITETVIHEHPGMELLIPGSRTNTLRLQGTRRTSQVLY